MGFPTWLRNLKSADEHGRAGRSRLRTPRRRTAARTLSVEPLEGRALLSSGALLQTLTNPDPAYFDEIGRSVAISGTTALVGSIYDDSGAENAGAAYVFDATSGAPLQTFTDPTPTFNGLFGQAVAISGNIVLVGAPESSAVARNAG